MKTPIQSHNHTQQAIKIEKKLFVIVSQAGNVFHETAVKTQYKLIKLLTLLMQEYLARPIFEE